MITDQIGVFLEVKVGVGFGVGGLESWRVVRSDLGVSLEVEVFEDYG